MRQWSLLVLLACRPAGPAEVVVPVEAGDDPVPPVAEPEPAGRVVDVTLGVGGTCFALDTGAVHCHGMLPPARGRAVPGFEDIIDVEIGGPGPDLCGVRRDGRIVCTGVGFDEVRRGRPIAGISDATVLAGRGGTFCAIRKGGTVVCWGDRFPLGGAGAERLESPTAVPGVEGVERLERASYSGLCAVSDGARTCWGKGAGTTGAAFGPDRVSQYGKARSVSGAGSTAVVLSDGALAFLDPPPEASEKARLEGMPALASVAVGGFHGCGVAEGGDVWCFPNPADKDRRVRLANKHAQLGAGHTEPEPRPIKTSLTDATKVVAATMRSCAITGGGELYCWGKNELGELGPRAFVTAVPVKVKLPSRATAIRSKGAVTCALLDDGALYCWGGEAVMDRFDARPPSALDVPPTDRFDIGYVICGASGARGWCFLGGDQLGTFDAGKTTDLTVGFATACGRQPDGRVVCWQPQGGETAKPVAVKSARAKRLSSVGSAVIIQTETGATLELPDVIRVDRGPLSAAQSALPGRAEIVAGSHTMRCVHRAGRTTCFGSKMKQLHDFEGHRFTRIAAGLSHACGVTQELAVVCWGGSRMGQLGTFAMMVPPTKLEGIPNATDVAAGPEHTCILTTAGEVLCLGSEVHAALGRPAKSDTVTTPTVLYKPPG